MSPRMLVGMVFLSLAVPAFAFGNPSMLPKHPGYPSKGEFANDTGQRNLTRSNHAPKEPPRKTAIRFRSSLIAAVKTCCGRKVRDRFQKSRRRRFQSTRLWAARVA